MTDTEIRVDPTVAGMSPRGRRTELACAWLGLVGLSVSLVGFSLARFFPVPPRASESSAQVVHFYEAHLTSFRIGVMLAGLGVCFIGPVLALITLHMWRMARGTTPVLAILQAITGAVTWVLLLIPMVIFEVVAFHPEANPDTTRALHDLAWLLFLTPVGPFSGQNLIIAAGIFSDRGPDPVLPRWVGYLNVWVGISFVPALMAYFFKTGPFAWHGVFVFYFGVAFYGMWLLAMSVELIKSVNRYHATA